MQKSHGKLTFFRQSGWMLMATVAGGAFMWAVHPVVTKPVDQVNLGPVTELLKKIIQPPISTDEYGLVIALIQMTNLMGIPAVGLQTVFAQQTAAALSEAQERQLRGTMRGVIGACFVIWLMVLITGILFGNSIIRVTWFAWCMLPLPLSNVLITHLLAQQRYKAIPWLMLVILSYGLTLVLCCSKLAQAEPISAYRTVVQVLGGFGLVLLCVAAWFTWGAKYNSNSGDDSRGSWERKRAPGVVHG